jgi:hypothetical protein
MFKLLYILIISIVIREKIDFVLFHKALQVTCKHLRIMDNSEAQLQIVTRLPKDTVHPLRRTFMMPKECK